MAASAGIAIIVVLLPLVLMLVVGIYLIVASRRGNGLGYPSCGACQYDLSASVGAVTRCPECGADFKTVGITPPGGKRSKPMLITGIVLLILPATCAGGILVSALLDAARSPQQMPTFAPPPLTPTTVPADPSPIRVPSDAPPTPIPQVTDEAEIDTTG